MSAPPVGSSTSAPGKAFLHVGLMKTGTSYLQSHLWDSPTQLAATGVRMVPDGRAESFTLVRAVRGLLQGEGHTERAREALESLRTRVSQAQEPTLLLSQELLGAAKPDQAARLLECFEGREVHVVVTARDVARQLPSAWQQGVKGRRDIGFRAYLRAVRERTPPGRSFWDTQDLIATLDSWGRHLPPERVHVVVVPPTGADRTLLAERFGSVVGVDFSRLVAVELRTNHSLDPAQVALVRRVNRIKGIPDRFERARTIKKFFVAEVLAPRRGAPAKTPVGMAPWCRRLAQRQIDYIEQQGFEVVGDIRELLPRDEDFGPRLTPVDDAQVAEIAVSAIADLLVRHNEREAEVARLRAENERLVSELEQLRGPTP